MGLVFSEDELEMMDSFLGFLNDLRIVSDLFSLLVVLKDDVNCD